MLQSGSRFLFTLGEDHAEINLASRTTAGNPPLSLAQGGKGVVVPGCPTCQKRINTMNQFLDHLAEDAMPALIERLSTKDVAIRA